MMSVAMVHPFPHRSFLDFSACMVVSTITMHHFTAPTENFPRRLYKVALILKVRSHLNTLM